MFPGQWAYVGKMPPRARRTKSGKAAITAAPDPPAAPTFSASPVPPAAPVPTPTAKSGAQMEAQPSMFGFLNKHPSGSTTRAPSAITAATTVTAAAMHASSSILEVSVQCILINR